jgi:hypothetical protein
VEAAPDQKSTTVVTALSTLIAAVSRRDQAVDADFLDEPAETIARTEQRSGWSLLLPPVRCRDGLVSRVRRVAISASATRNDPFDAGDGGDPLHAASLAGVSRTVPPPLEQRHGTPCGLRPSAS